MKRFVSLFVCILALLVIGSCGSSPAVARVDSGTQVDLSGRWNDSDVRLVCNSLITDCLNSPRVTQYVQQFSDQHGGNLPACLVGAFTNDTSEHGVDTSIIAMTMETAIGNSNKIEVVAGGDTLTAIRAERQDQQSNASEERAVALAKEVGANLLLTGSVKSSVDQAGNVTVRSYFVYARLTNVETRVQLWAAENSEIKKVITQSNYRP
jgi:hypothetical protein